MQNMYIYICIYIDTSLFGWVYKPTLPSGNQEVEIRKIIYGVPLARLYFVAPNNKKLGFPGISRAPLRNQGLR